MAGLEPQSFHVVDNDGVMAEPVETPTEHVGAFLREARETTGRSLADVAASLHIRGQFLRSIEEGRYEDLPGPTYAVGFIRSYSDLLGLDTDALTARFKNESKGAEGLPELECPAPTTDGWFPTGKVVASCVVLAGALFSGWSYLQTDKSVDVATVPQPPGFEENAGDPGIAAAIVAETAPSLGGDAADADSEISKTAEAVSDSAEPAPEAVAETVTATAQAPVSASAATIVAEVEKPKPEPIEVKQEKPVAPPAPAPAEVVAEVDELTPSVSSVERTNVTEDQPAAVVVSSTNTQVASLADTPVSDAESSPSGSGRTFGDVNQASRVVVGARADSWVQVLDSNQNVLLTRMLRPGDRYLVPTREDLVMLTGNAGGLIISVDGEQVPSIGSDGAILHNVRLDGDLLKAGRAVIK